MLGSVLLSVGFALPFFFDAGSFAVAAGLVFLIAGQYRAPQVEGEPRRPWRQELAEGVRWLRGHELLWPMAIILGLLNAMGMMVFATLVLFGQEVLHTSARTFAVLGTGGAVGGIVGSLAAPRISRAIGAGPSLALTMVGGAVGAAALAVTSSWQVAWLAFAIEAGFGSLWNVITVSLRQTIVPDQLLGRVNSVYRFLGWGMMPIGSLIGGLAVALADTVTTREMALRVPYVIAVSRQPRAAGLRQPTPDHGQDRSRPCRRKGPAPPRHHPRPRSGRRRPPHSLTGSVRKRGPAATE